MLRGVQGEHFIKPICGGVSSSVRIIAQPCGPSGFALRSRVAALLSLSLILLVTGCAAYKRCALTPDSVNYTLSRDRKTGDLTDYFGTSWNLK